jgi:hypothetical protein
MPNLKPSVARLSQPSAPRGSHAHRGRPPKKAYINVLVRTSTRSALTQLKASIGLMSQGEVIDYLVERIGQEASGH